MLTVVKAEEMYGRPPIDFEVKLPFESSGALCCKVFKAGKEISLPHYKYFTKVEELEPSSLLEVYKLLEKYRYSRDTILVREQSHTSYGSSFRLITEGFTDLLDPVVYVDFDSIPGSDPFLPVKDQAEYALNIIRKYAPEVFPEDVSYIAKASGSSRVKAGIRLHMVFFNHTSLTRRQIQSIMLEINERYKKDLHTDKNLVDTSMYSSVRKIYFTDPIILDSSNKQIDIYQGEPRMIFKEGEYLQIPANTKEYEPSDKSKSEFSVEMQDALENRFEGLLGDDGNFNLLEDSVGDKLLKQIAGIYQNNIGMKYSNISALNKVRSNLAKLFNIGYDYDWLVNKQIAPIIYDYIKRNGKPQVEFQDYMKPIVQYYKYLTNIGLRKLENGDYPLKDILLVGTDESIGKTSTVLQGYAVKKIEAEYDVQPLLDSTGIEIGYKEYLKMSTLPPEGMTFVKASLGSGKTYAISQFIEKGMIEGRFLSITNTRSLVRSNAESFKAGMYTSSRDIGDYYSGRRPRLCTTLHSLHTLHESSNYTLWNKPIDLVFIDEADAVLNDIVFSDIVKKENREALGHIIRTAKRIVLSDGDLSAETIAGYIELARSGRFRDNVYYIDFTPKMLGGESPVEAIECTSVQSLLAGVSYNLGPCNQKVLLVTDCGPEKIETYKAVIEDDLLEQGLSLPGIMTIHSLTTDTPEVKDVFKRRNEALRDRGIRFLITSPSVTSGLDLNYFNVVAVITETSNQTPYLRFQAMRRDRGAREIIYYNKPSVAGISTGLPSRTKTEAERNKIRDMLVACATDLDDPTFINIRYWMLSRKIRETRLFHHTFRWLLLDQGAKVSVCSPEDLMWDRLSISKVAKEVGLHQAASMIYYSKADCVDSRYGLENVKTRSEICKFYEVTDSELTLDTVKEWLKERPVEKAETILKVYNQPKLWHYFKLGPKEFKEALQKDSALENMLYKAIGGLSKGAGYYRMYYRACGVDIVEGMLDFTRIKDYVCRLYNSQPMLGQIPKEFLPEELQHMVKDNTKETHNYEL